MTDVFFEISFVMLLKIGNASVFPIFLSVRFILMDGIYFILYRHQLLFYVRYE